MFAAEANALVPAPVCLLEIDRAFLTLLFVMEELEPNPPPPLVGLDFFFSAMLRLLLLLLLMLPVPVVTVDDVKTIPAW